MKSTNDFSNWWLDFLSMIVLLSFIFIFDYGSILERSARSSRGSGISGLFRLIHSYGGKTFVYGFIGIGASFFFVRGMRKFIREWHADEPQGNEKDSPAQLIKHYQTLCDVLLARGLDDAYNDLTSINSAKGTASWAKEVGEALSDLKGKDPVAFNAVVKWAKYFMEID